MRRQLYRVRRRLHRWRIKRLLKKHGANCPPGMFYALNPDNIVFMKAKRWWR